MPILQLLSPHASPRPLVIYFSSPSLSASPMHALSSLSTSLFPLSSFNLPTMADQRVPGFGPTWARSHYQSAAGTSGWQGLVRRLQEHAPNSTQLVGFLTLVISGCILLFLAGATLIGAVATAVVVGPIVLLTSPIWVPVAFITLGAAVVVFSACGFTVACVAGAAWLYRYFMGRHPVGSDRVDYARSRIADTAREYSGYLKKRVKDAAPGA